jgi:hypothetical protein
VSGPDNNQNNDTRMNINKSLTTNWAGGIALLGAAVGLVVGVYFLFQNQPDNAVRLPVLAIGGVIALLVVIALVAGAYTLFGLANPAEALGLPEGSVRAVIALSLIVLFAILTIYLYSDVSHPEVCALAGLSQAELDKFLTSAHGEKVIATVNTAQAGPAQYTIYYQNISAAGGDFAKQLLVMIGTLMTSVTSFYFAAKTTISTNGGSTDTSTPAPEPTGVSPQEGDRGSTLSLDISGHNLGDVTSVKLVLDKDELVATGLVASAGLVKCNVNLPADMKAGSWTVKVADKSGRSAELADALTIL